MGKKILVLGSGLVAKPCVDYLLRDSQNSVTVASRTLSKAQALTDSRPNTTALALEVTSDSLAPLIANHDVVISLVPFTHHATVIKAAIAGKTHVVTTSYVSPAMRALHAEAKEAGIVVLNEVGLDPGIDHFYAVKTIGEVHKKGGKVLEFYSYCGGLPAPEAVDNPLKFKFSWSPRGALLSQYNSATFLQDGEVVTIPNTKLMGTAKPYHVIDGYDFVAYPNRDSTPFRDFYSIPEAKTVVRGSLRYEGNPALVKALIELGWLDQSEKDWLKPGGSLTWAEIQARATNAKSATEDDLLARVDELCTFNSPPQRDEILAGLRWMGLFSTQPATLRSNLLDTLSAQLEKLCSFKPGERDLVMLQHKFVVEWADGKTNTITSTLELLGDSEPGGYSAMSKSVGVTCGIATQLLLDGHPAFAKPGVWAPYSKEMCDPLRIGVEREGIKLVERVY